jgi:hypothetical protein
MTIRCIVAGINSNGEPDLFFVKVSANEPDIHLGLHCDAALYEACQQGYENPMVAFDENDSAGRAMLPLFQWDTASVVEVK